MSSFSSKNPESCWENTIAIGDSYAISFTVEEALLLAVDARASYAMRPTDLCLFIFACFCLLLMVVLYCRK